MFSIPKNVKYSLLFSFLIFVNCQNETKEKDPQSVDLKQESIVDSSQLNTENQDTIIEKDSISQLDTIAKSIDKKDSLDDKQYIYLTFDDGPFKGSKKISHVISEENIPATVFLVGYNAFTPELKSFIKEYKNNTNIELANHTYSHGDQNKFKHYYLNAEHVLKDLERNNDSILFPNKIVRFPGRNVWRVGEKRKNDFDKTSSNVGDFIAKKQYAIYGWDYEWRRANKGQSIDSPEIIYSGIVDRLNKNYTFEKNHLVLLMHDNMFNEDIDAEKLRKLIQLIKQNNKLVFEVISKYPVKDSKQKI